VFRDFEQIDTRALLTRTREVLRSRVQRDVGSAVGHGRRLACGVDVLGIPLRPRLGCEVNLVLLVVGLGLGEADLHLSYTVDYTLM
jgi:hypothetical protein